MSDRVRCNACRFWQRDDPQYIYGFCHRYPPVPDISVSMKPARYGEGGEVHMMRRAEPIYANTHEDDWCGEFALQAAASEAEGRGGE